MNFTFALQGAAVPVNCAYVPEGEAEGLARDRHAWPRDHFPAGRPVAFGIFHISRAGSKPASNPLWKTFPWACVAEGTAPARRG